MLWGSGFGAHGLSRYTRQLFFETLEHETLKRLQITPVRSLQAVDIRILACVEFRGQRFARKDRRYLRNNDQIRQGPGDPAIPAIERMDGVQLPHHSSRSSDRALILPLAVVPFQHVVYFKPNLRRVGGP